MSSGPEIEPTDVANLIEARALADEFVALAMNEACDLGSRLGRDAYLRREFRHANRST